VHYALIQSESTSSGLDTLFSLLKACWPIIICLPHTIDEARPADSKAASLALLIVGIVAAALWALLLLLLA